MGFDPPTRQSLCEGARPEIQEPDDFAPGMREAVAERGCITGGEQMTPQARALVRSQVGLEAAWRSPLDPPQS